MAKQLNDRTKRNLIYGVGKKRERERHRVRDINIHCHWRPAVVEKWSVSKVQRTLIFGPTFLIDPGTATGTCCCNPWGEPSSWWRRAFDLCAFLWPPSMCTGGCARCLGGTLIPLAVFGLLANILLFFPGGKVVNDKSHLSDEVWYFGGILGSGVLVSRETLTFPRRQILVCPYCRRCHFEAYNLYAMKSSALIYFPFLFAAGDSLVY